MEEFARIFIFLEMLLVNLITSDRSSRRRYSIIRIIGELFLFTVLVLFVSFIIRYKLNLKYLNSYMIIIIGLTYFFPLKHLYLESLENTLSIMFFSWIHTITVFYFATQFTISLGFKNHYQTTLIVQTIIYLFSTSVIIKFVKSRFLYILKNIPPEMNKVLFILSLAEFITLTIFSLCIIESTHSYWKLITVLLLVLTAAVSYHLIYIIVKNSKNIIFLKELAYTDNLTGIKNRLSFFLDCEKLISKKKSFAIIYMDLDNFKKVNDTYGHSTGDYYLKQFTKATIEIVGDRGCIYRMSGDEFVCLYKENKIECFLETFEEKIREFLEMDICFLGVSIGYARFPEEANSINDLIKKADRIMYKVKRSAID